MPRKAIYLTREDSGRRRVLNRDDIYDLLTSEGFEVEKLMLTTYKTDISKAHQILHRAGLVIGPHGAGFANIVAFNPQAAVIEFHAEKFQVRQ